MLCIPAGGNSHGLSTPKRNTEETNICDTVPMLTPVRGMSPAGGHTHGLSTPKRKYTEQEKTRIHYAVPKNAPLRDLSVGTPHIKIVDRIKCSS